MKALQLLTAPCIYAEFGQSSLTVLQNGASLEVPLERQENGRLTAACRERLVAALQTFLKKKSWQPRQRAICAISARGVSLRRLSLPGAPTEEIHKLLQLQIEKEFPLPPDALAWGCRPLGGTSGGANGRREFLVAAVKKDIVEDYFEVLSACGLSPVFTVAALARNGLCPQPGGSYAVLDIGRKQSELTTFDNGVPGSIRIVHWGGDNITRAIEEKLGVSYDEAEKIKLQSEQSPASNGELGCVIEAALPNALHPLVGALQGNWPRLYLTGKSARQKALASRLREGLGNRVECEAIALAEPDHSAAIVALRKAAEKDGRQAALLLRFKEKKGAGSQGRAALIKWQELAALVRKDGDGIVHTSAWKWARLALALGVCCLVFPYAEALIAKPYFSRKLAAIKADRGRLPLIDRELGFLQHLKKNQPPYLDALTILGNAAAPGTRFDSLSMNRRGDVSLRGTMQNLQQVTDFRSKLIKSGFFAGVTVEEQTPTPDRQRVTVRMTAQWKPANARQHVTIDLSPPEARPYSPPMGFPSPMDGGGGPGPVPGGMMPPPMDMGGMRRGGPIMRGPMSAPDSASPGNAQKFDPGARYGMPAAGSTNSGTTDQIKR